MNLNDQTVMVAGGAGFVGSAVVRELLSRDIRTVSYDNYLHGVPANIAALDGAFQAVCGDVLEPWQLIEAVRSHGVTTIIHCVGDTFVPTAYEMPQRFFDINLQGTLNLLRTTKICGLKRLVFVSTTEVYGPLDEERANENTRLNPVNTYAVSKLAADRLCYTFAIEHDVPVIIARIFNCYGPRETQPYIIPEIIAQLNRGSRLRLGNVEAERDFTYVHDTARALIALAEADLPPATVVNVGSDVCYSVAWLARRLAEIMGVENMAIEQDTRRLRVKDIPRFRCDNALLKKLTGWSPQVAIEEGLRLTVQWFRENRCRWSYDDYVDDTTIYR
ncbi:MAG: NAD(P)-dependent oxidoreductase [Planctomycetes bacterium]|nr:NAD(P)-dependent oxidoreductase [Planctomycetota bacterium]